MDLLEYSGNIRSQNGEDGIIQEILNILSASTPPYKMIGILLSLVLGMESF